MRTIHTDQIIKTIRQMCIDANLRLSEDVKSSICGAIRTEKSPLGRQILEQLEENMDMITKICAAIEKAGTHDAAAIYQIMNPKQEDNVGE